MVFARTWSKELVSEWLTALGYAVLVGVPVGTGRGGGRKDADIIGFKSGEHGVKIIHCEISSVWGSSRRVVDYVRSKFSAERVENIRLYVADITSSNNIIYEKHAIIFTSRGVIEKAKKILERDGIKLWSFQEFFNTQILPIVREKVKRARTFPDGLWLLNMLYTLCSEKLLNEYS